MKNVQFVNTYYGNSIIEFTHNGKYQKHEVLSYDLYKPYILKEIDTRWCEACRDIDYIFLFELTVEQTLLLIKSDIYLDKMKLN